MVIETACSQYVPRWLSDAKLWVTARPNGGGAALWVGLWVQPDPPPGTNRRLYVRTLTALGPMSPKLEFGLGSACRREGDPAFFLWLPLHQVLAGCPLSVCILAGARIFLWGLCAGWWRVAWGFWSFSAWRDLWVRACSPWGAIPVDLFRIREEVNNIDGLPLQ